MTNIFKNIFIPVLACMLLWSCKKDGTTIVAVPDGNATLTASTTSVNLNPDAPTAEALGLNWSPVDYGYEGVVSYVLQITVKDSNFVASALDEMTLTSGSKTFTVEELNRELVKILPPNKKADLQARIKTFIGTNNGLPTYSNVVNFTATPYKVTIPYTSLYVAGSYQGWSPSTAPRVASANNNGQYEGYVYMGVKNNEFKFAAQPSWGGPNYGDGGAGKLSDAGGNLLLPDSSYYFLKANTGDLTWTATKVSWGIMGNLVAGSGDWIDYDMTFDPVSQIWSITLNATAGGEFKFRANHDWTINFGDKAPMDGIPDTENDNNIKITETGKYTIILDLSIAGPKNYSYIIKKI